MKRPFGSEAANYTLYGVLFGACFPAVAGPMDCWLHTGALSIAGLLEVERTNPLLWIINTAPAWLGLFARFAGVRQDAFTPPSPNAMT